MTTGFGDNPVSSPPATHAMALPHLDRPICEPVELQAGSPVRVERVRQGPYSGPSDSFVHFHEVHELVLFGQVQGHFDADNRRYALNPHALVFVPSMQQHDFALERGARDWVLLQVSAGVCERLAGNPGLERLRESFCARPGGALRRRLQQLADWLLALPAHDPLVLPLAELLLAASLRAPTVTGTALPGDSHGLQRLRPAIDQLRRYPANAPGVQQAAMLCALSPAYFSRRFTQLVGMSWSDYVRTHRLQLASRRLLETSHSIATIASDLGFATPSHFGELFHRCFGLTPGQYRQAGRPPVQ
jgi:AraC-like DNA-binding protein